MGPDFNKDIGLSFLAFLACVWLAAVFIVDSEINLR